MAAEFDITTIKTATDQYLAEILSSRTESAGKISQRYQLLWSHIETVAKAGGKRIRPYLTVIGYGNHDEKIVPVATAQELLHIAMLMHDDIIDQDTMRHNLLNINGTYEEIYKPYVGSSLSTHYANSMAILAGDALISEAYKLICHAPFDEVITQRLAERLGESIFEVIGGELLDVEASIIDDEVFDPITMYRYKTAGYSFVGPLVTGAICRQASEEEINILTNYGINAGIAFQIQDDLLGIFGDEKQTGKLAYCDLREAKQTIIIVEHKNKMNDIQAERFGRYFGNLTASEDELSLLKDDIRISGAEKEAQVMIDRYFAQASDELNKLSDGVQKQKLKEFLGMLMGRRR